jgi:type IV secretion system protein VirD4
MRRVLPSLLFVLFLGGGSAPLLAQFDYLREMPTVAAVKEAFTDPDPLQAAAKQIAAFAELQEIGVRFIGRYDAMTNAARQRPAERELYASYRGAIHAIRSTPGLDPQEASNAAMRLSSIVAPEVRKRFFSDEFRAEFVKAEERYVRYLAEGSAKGDDGTPASAQRRPAAGAGGSTAQDAGYSESEANWMVALVYIGGPILLFLVWRKIRVGKGSGFAAHGKREMEKIGATVDERTKKIDHLFTHRSESLSFDLNANSAAAGAVKASITRSIAAMPAREREMLRALYHLHNSGFCDAENFHWARLALIYGDGKAQVTNAWFARSATVHDFPTAMKELMGTMTAETTVSLVLDWVGAAAKAQKDHPVVKQLAERLFGGGAASLSSADGFVAAHRGKEPAMILGLAEEGGAAVTYAGDGAAITIAPPRCGKSLSQVFPTLLTWNGPAVVLDVKNEIYQQTSRWRSQHVGPVYRFSPLDPANSHRYNPLAAVRSDPEFVWEDSRFLADMMIVPANSKDTFWQDGARDVLTAAIARACLSDDEQQRSIAAVLDVFHGVGWETFIKELSARSDLRSMRRAASSLGSMDRKTLDGVLKTGLTSLSAWDGDRIERATRSSDWAPGDLRTGENPTIYICMGATEVASYVSVLRVLLAQHIRALMAALPPKGSTPILFMLDELPQLKHMPPIEQALEVGAGFGIRLWMFAQSVGQMKEAYPNADGMIGACAVRMFMNPSQHDGLAQKLSEDIGYQEGVLDGQRQKIVEANVLAGEDYRDYVIVMPSGFKPFRLKKNFAFANPDLQARMGSV